MKKSRFAQIDLNIPLAVLSLGLFWVGLVIPMMNHQDDKIDKALAGIREDVNAMRGEMRDFHDRLVEIEARRG